MEEAHLATRAQQVAHYSAVRARLNDRRNAFQLGFVPPEKWTGAGDDSFLVRFTQSLVVAEELSAGTRDAIEIPPAYPLPVPPADDPLATIVFRLSVGVRRPVSREARVRASGHNARAIIRQTAAEHGLKAEEIVGPRRFRPLVEARHAAIWRVCVACPKLSLAQIADLFGQRDHTTILHAYRRMEEMLRDGPFASAVEELMHWSGCSLDEAIEHFRSPPSRLAYHRQAQAFEAA